MNPTTFKTFILHPSTCDGGDGGLEKFIDKPI
jgi:hypothetical protein